MSSIHQKIYEYLRLTMSDFDRIPDELIHDEIVAAEKEVKLIPGDKEQVIYNGKQVPFFMFVFEVKKNILNK